MFLLHKLHHTVMARWPWDLDGWLCEKIISRCVIALVSRIPSLKTESCHGDNLVITGGCHNNSLYCCPWQHCWNHVNSQFSVFWARFLSLARSKLRLCSANHRPGARPSIFRSNSKFDENSKHSSVKYTRPITTIFCTRHDSVTVVTCAKYRCDRSSIFETRAFWIFIEFRIRSKYA